MAAPGRSSHLISSHLISSHLLRSHRSSLLAASEAKAQGPFRWQFSPFCNVVTLSAVSQGSVFDVSGSDDGCGGPARSGATGIAFFNPDGTISMSLTVIGSTGVPRDVAVQLQPTLSGTWRDASGNTGAFVFNPGTVTGLPLPAPVLPAGPTGPAGPQGPPGPAVLTVFDAVQRKVGDVVGLDTTATAASLAADPMIILTAPNNGPLFSVRARSGGFRGSHAQVFFVSNDCSGPALMDAQVSGLLAASFVASDQPALTVLVANISAGVSTVNTNSSSQGTNCFPVGPSALDVHQTLSVDLGAPFTPPFTIRLAAP